MRRWCLALLVIAWLRPIAHADPGTSPAPEPAHPDRDATVRAPAGAGATAPDPHTPWIDLAPTEVLEHHAQPVEHEDHKVASAITMGAMYAGFIGWTYLAWYRKHHPLSQFKWGGDGWVGDQTYAGGADKFGHAWATMGLARAGTEMLSQWGGYDRTTSNIIGSAAAELLFAGVEVKDGFYYEFSFSDLTGDTLGALAGFALSEWPRLDEMFDYRVEYWPSVMYQRKLSGASPCPTGSCSKFNIAEDYSGETYQIAFHLGSIHALRDMKYGTIARFVDVAAGFGSRNYKPDPVTMADKMAAPGRPTQELFLGLTLNAQGLFDWLLEGHHSRGARATRKITHGLFEMFSVPGTYPAIEYDHSPCPTCKVNTDGA